MTSESSTRALGSTTVVFGWVEESLVQEILHASDGFQVLLAVTLAGIGASVAVVVALAAGALHPIAMYLILSAVLTGTALAAAVTIREYRRYRRVRSRLLDRTAHVPVPVLLTTPGAPTFTVGGQAPVMGLAPAGSATATSSSGTGGPLDIEDVAPAAAVLANEFLGTGDAEPSGPVEKEARAALGKDPSLDGPDTSGSG